MKKITALIIDDERRARDEIRRHLEQHPDVDIRGEAANIRDAAAMITQNRPDLIFLDVQMPGGSGFDLLETLETVPQVIFTTAFDRFAVRAFEVEAIDYLVKPVSEERFARAMERIRANLSLEQKENPPDPSIFIREGERCYFIRSSQISRIESSGNYVKIHFDDKKALVKRSLTQLSKRLPARQFFRVNRNAIINTDFISKIKPLPDGRLEITLRSGPVFTVSSRQSAFLKNRSSL